MGRLHFQLLPAKETQVLSIKIPGNRLLIFMENCGKLGTSHQRFQRNNILASRNEAALRKGSDRKQQAKYHWHYPFHL